MIRRWSKPDSNSRSHPRLPCRVRRRNVPGSDSASVRAVTWANAQAAPVPYRGTIPIQNMVLSPTSISYLRTKVSLPSSPIRNTERPAGIVFTVSPSFTFTGKLCCATSKRPLGSM